MSDRQPSTENHAESTDATARALLQSALDQFHEDALHYNVAVGSFNTHLDNHRERRDLDDLPFRDPITSHPSFDAVVNGDRDAIETLLSHLIDQAHLDSDVRRHPRTFPIHEDALEHLQIARGRVISTLEEALWHLEATDG